jgi:hypothetical protein
MSENKVIDKLTPEQEAATEHYREKWLAIGLNTERVVPVLAEEAVRLMYKCGGLDAPTRIMHAGGPIAAAKILKKEKKIKSFDSSNVFFGHHEAGWLSFYDFFQSECGIDFGGKLDGIFAVAQECGWVYLFRDLAVIQDRYEILKRDEQHRLHCETGPAVRFTDGFEYYSWHGVNVPAEWIRDRSLTAKEAITWPNAEQRRAAFEIVTWAKILDELNAKVIDEDADPQIGTLLEVDVPDIGTQRLLKVVCGTGRVFAIPVPPEMETALEANAWTYDMPADEYNPEVRT